MMLNALPSWGFWRPATSGSTLVPVILPLTGAPATNGPSNVTPNHVPNSCESDIARQTRLSGARRTTFFSMVSAVVVMQPPGCILAEPKTICNLLVAFKFVTSQIDFSVAQGLSDR